MYTNLYTEDEKELNYYFSIDSNYRIYNEMDLVFNNINMILEDKRRKSIDKKEKE